MGKDLEFVLRFKNEARATFSQVKNDLKGLGAQLGAVQSGIKSMSSANTSANTTMAASAQAILRTESAQKRLELQQQRLVLQSSKLNQQEASLMLGEQKLALQIDRLTLAQGRLEASRNRLSHTQQKFSLQSREASIALNGLSAGMGAGAAIGNKLAAVLGAVGLALVGKAAIDAGIRLDQLTNRMAAATKSADLTGKGMEFVAETTDRLGLSFQSSADGFAGFAASALRAGLDFGTTKQIFEDISTAAASLQLPVERVELIFKALEQIAGKGTVSMEELKQQLGDSLPGAFEIAAKSMGKTNAEFVAMVTNGEVVSKDFLPKFAATIREELGGSAEKAATQLQAETNRMKNSFFELQTEFSKNGAGEAYTKVVRELSALFRDKNFKDGITSISSGILNLTTNIIDATHAFNNFFGITKNGEITRLKTRIAEIQADPGGTGPFQDINKSLREAELKGLQKRLDKINDIAAAEKTMAGAKAQYLEDQARIQAALAGKKYDPDKVVLGGTESGPTKAELEAAKKAAAGATRQAKKDTAFYANMDAEIAQLKEETFWVGKSSKERERATAILKAQQEALKAGIKDFDPAQYVTAYDALTAAQQKVHTDFATGLSAAFQEFKDSAKGMGDVAQDLFKQASDGITTTLTGLVDGSINSFQSLKQGIGSILKDIAGTIAKFVIQQQIIAPLLSSFGMFMGGGGSSMANPNIAGTSYLLSAKGNAFSHGSAVKYFAKGGVLNGPTAFPMNGGTAIGGEAGAEGLLPLKRLSNGHLGVQAEGGGSNGGTFNYSPSFSFNMSNGTSAPTDKNAANQLAKNIDDEVRKTVLKVITEQKRDGGILSGGKGKTV